MKDTKLRILDMAESLFSKHSMESVSIRKVMSEAGLNLALAHYHFKSRRLLIQAVLERRLLPLNEKRVKLLEELIEAKDENNVTLAEVMRAFFSPVIDLLEEHPDFARFLGQVYVSPEEDFRTYFYDFFVEILHRFSDAARDLLPPEITRSQRLCRAFFLFGAMNQILIAYQDLEQVVEGKDELLRGDDLLNELVGFCVAGLLS